jgi:hypothetical protein
MVPEFQHRLRDHQESRPEAGLCQILDSRAITAHCHRESRTGEDSCARTLLQRCIASSSPLRFFDH